MGYCWTGLVVSQDLHPRCLAQTKILDLSPKSPEAWAPSFGSEPADSRLDHRGFDPNQKGSRQESRHPTSEEPGQYRSRKVARNSTTGSNVQSAVARTH